MRFKIAFFAIALAFVALIALTFYSCYGIIAGTTATMIALAAVIGTTIYTFRPPIETED